MAPYRMMLLIGIKNRGEIIMCVYCGGSLKEATMDYVEKIDNYVIVIKNVPCINATNVERNIFPPWLPKN